MSEMKKITVASGDGIGPEIMDATLKILAAAGARIETEFINIGEQVYLSGNTSGIESSSWASLRSTKVFLKAPITTPLGGGYKSLNVTIRKTMGLFANVRPVYSFYPYVNTKHPKMDMVIVRENEEDLYSGIEHRQTNDVVQCLKIMSRPGTEKIIRYAFEYAKAYGRKKVTCMAKDNIMKITDGMFHKVFQEVGKEYPEIEQDYKIIDIGSALLAERPEAFDVVVTTNLYGDIVSDIVAQISGSVGLGGSANIGTNLAMFEAIHGSAPDIAGKNMANPSGLINAAVMMLVHIGQGDVAEKIANAWLKTIEEGIHTGDIYNEKTSKQKVGTKEFAEAVIERLGQLPTFFAKVDYTSSASKPIELPAYERQVQKKELVGVDLFMDWAHEDANQIGDALTNLAKGSGLKLKMITNRGVKVYPNGFPETFCTDHWRCRFVGENGGTLSYKQVLELSTTIIENNFDIIKTENLYTFDGALGYSLGQGE